MRWSYEWALRTDWARHKSRAVAGVGRCILPARVRAGQEYLGEADARSVRLTTQVCSTIRSPAWARRVVRCWCIVVLIGRRCRAWAGNRRCLVLSCWPPELAVGSNHERRLRDGVRDSTVILEDVAKNGEYLEEEKIPYRPSTLVLPLHQPPSQKQGSTYTSGTSSTLLQATCTLRAQGRWRNISHVNDWRRDVRVCRMHLYPDFLNHAGGPIRIDLHDPAHFEIDRGGYSTSPVRNSPLLDLTCCLPRAKRHVHRHTERCSPV